MVRAVIQDGRFEPLDPLPSDWKEGQQVHVLSIPAEESDDASSPEEIAAWLAVEEHRRIDKEYVRREMGLP